MTRNLVGNARTLSPEAPGEDYVAVMFAETRAESQACSEALIAGGIPSRIEDDDAVGRSVGISVLVPSSRLEEAAELLAAREIGCAGDVARAMEVKAGPADDDEDSDDFDDDEDDDDDDADDEEDEEDDLFDDDDDDDLEFDDDDADE